MRNRLAIGLALLGVCGVSSYAEEISPTPAPACQLKRLASLDLDSTGGLMLIPVSINGTDVWMYMHSGSIFTVIYGNATSLLKLEPRAFNGDLRARIGGEKLSKVVNIGSLKLGNLTISGATLVVGTSRNGGTPFVWRDRPIVGTVGMDTFNNVDFEIYPAANKLNIFSHDHCKGNVVYWTKTYAEVSYSADALGNIVFPMELDGKNIEATLATGSQVTKIDSNITSKVYGFDEDSPGIARSTSGGDGEDVRYKAMALSAPGINVTNTEIRLQKGNKRCGQVSRKAGEVDAIGYADCYGVVPLSLGMNVLKMLRIYVSTGEKIMYISRADAN